MFTLIGASAWIIASLWQKTSVVSHLVLCRTCCAFQDGTVRFYSGPGDIPTTRCTYHPARGPQPIGDHPSHVRKYINTSFGRACKVVSVSVKSTLIFRTVSGFSSQLPVHFYACEIVQWARYFFFKMSFLIYLEWPKCIMNCNWYETSSEGQVDVNPHN